MIEIIKISPDPKLKRFINRISIFKSKNIIEYKHKLTPSAFTYLSYNHADIPTSIFGNNKILPDRRLQIAGPKINEDIAKISEMVREKDPRKGVWSGLDIQLYGYFIVVG